MGNWNSVENKNEQRADKMFQIETLGNKLNREYTEKYLDPDFCNQVTMINSDELIRFQHQKVNDKSYSFGYIGDVPQVKEAICEGIQEEYRLKKELVSLILSCFRECSARIDSISTGPVCRGNPEVFTEVDCTPPNEWLATVASPEEGLEQNTKWFTVLNEFHTFFMKNITILQNILNDLENHDSRFSIDRVKQMTKKVEKVKLALDIECAKLQRHMLTIPTFTDQEIKEQEKIDSENKQRVEAKRDALLTGNNISI
jgi:hypothetical protein